jgi:hypothetical protein
MLLLFSARARPRFGRGRNGTARTRRRHGFIEPPGVGERRGFGVIIRRLRAKPGENFQIAVSNARLFLRGQIGFPAAGGNAEIAMWLGPPQSVKSPNSRR